jgi:trans-2,3-dihydro-3-hydroxyanthranilate isomerase
MPLTYEIYDVFTEAPFGGNPLAIVHGAAHLDHLAMQSIAREFNLSETVFVLDAADPRHSAAIRIFMPVGEMPFAGHPTVGTAVALAARSGLDGPSILVLEENIGPVRCAVKGSFAEFDVPRLPKAFVPGANDSTLAAALNLDPQDIGFENHRVGGWSAGVPYVTIPVSGLLPAAKAHVNADAWIEAVGRVEGKVPAPWIYCRETVFTASDFHARMYAPWDGISEDPATGSAAAAFAGQIMRFDEPGGQTSLTIEQGVEFGRPSTIRLHMEVEGRTLVSARIGGHAVKVAEGTLYV